MELPADPKTVTGGWTQEPNNINPFYTVMSYAVWITQLTLVGLAEWDESGNLVPELATEVPSLENGGISEDVSPNQLNVSRRALFNWGSGIRRVVSAETATSYQTKRQEGCIQGRSLAGSG
jgi:peptide/nickel transport system substrate-binding protein